MSLLNNIWLKIVAVISGILLWLHVATEKEYQYRIELPITEVTLAENLTLSNRMNDSVKVFVAATGKQLMRQSWRNSGLRIQATDISAGRSLIYLNTANTNFVSSGNVALKEVISPTSLELSVDFVAEESLRVESAVVISVADGYVLGRVSPPEPPYVHVRGPRSKVQMLSVLTTELREIESLQDNITLTLTIPTPEEYDLVIYPDTVMVSVEVMAARTRVIDNLPVELRNAPEDRSLLLNPTTIRVEISGPPGEVDSLLPGACVAYVDYRDRNESGSIPLTVECPERFKIKKTSVSDIQVIEPN